MLPLLLTLPLGIAAPPTGDNTTLVFDEVVLGESHGCGRRSTGSVACWGANDRGQLGAGARASSPTPVPVLGLSDAVSLAAGDHHTCAIRRDRSLVCWGDNQAGQLATSALPTYATPLEVPGLGAVLSVAAGAVHTCAVATAGGVSCWGNNLYGQLGTTDVPSSPLPLPVMGVAGATMIAAGYGHTCAGLPGDASTPAYVLCWGDGRLGQLGRVDLAVPTSAPAPPTPLGAPVLGLRGLAARQHQTCMLDAEGVRCWGATPDQAVGQPEPQRVVTQSGLVQLSLGWGHGCALSGGHRVTCWGDDTKGQLGARLPRAVVVGAYGLVDASGVAAGRGETCAARTGGRLVCWGSYTNDEKAAAAQQRAPSYQPPRKVTRQLPPNTSLVAHTEEVLAPEGSRVRVVIQTVADQPCANARLHLEPEVKRRQHRLRIGEVFLPNGDCIATNAPATATYDLPTDATGRQDIVIRWQNKEDFFQLYVSDHKVEVIPLQTTFAFWQGETNTWRVPTGSLAISCTDWLDAPVCLRRSLDGLGTCRELRDLPEIVTAPALERRTFGNPWFAADPAATLISPDFDHDRFRALVEERWSDGSDCVDIAVRTWTGATWTNDPR